MACEGQNVWKTYESISHSAYDYPFLLSIIMHNQLLKYCSRLHNNIIIPLTATLFSGLYAYACIDIKLALTELLDFEGLE